MGVMQSLTPARGVDLSPIANAEVSAPDGIDTAMVEAIEHGRVPFRQWPQAVADLYRKEVVRRLYREEHFLFLVGMLLCLATVVVDMIANPALVPFTLGVVAM